jgi:hypothetical protein
VILVGKQVNDIRALLDESSKALRSLPLYVVVIHLGRKKDLVGTWIRARAGQADSRRSEIGTRENDCLHLMRWKPGVSLRARVASALAGVQSAVENYFVNRSISHNAARSYLLSGASLLFVTVEASPLVSTLPPRGSQHTRR